MVLPEGAKDDRARIFVGYNQNRMVWPITVILTVRGLAVYTTEFFRWALRSRLVRSDRNMDKKAPGILPKRKPIKIIKSPADELVRTINERTEEEGARFKADDRPDGGTWRIRQAQFVYEGVSCSARRTPTRRYP